MINTEVPIYLASKSPRRREMMKIMGLAFQSLSTEVEENIDENVSPLKNVKQISLDKCLSALPKINNGVVISADTIVVLDGEIIGKPKNKVDAKRILAKLSGKMHFVYTGFTIANKNNGKIKTSYSKTRVYFRELFPKEINDYVNSGSPMDKAGAYGIQDDYGAVFVEKIIGCYYNVLGFPASKIYKVLKSIL